MLNNSSAPGSAIPRPSWTSAALIALAVATLAVGFMTWKAYAAPAESTRATSQLLFEQTASFDYVVRVPPSSLYPNGTIGPIKDDADEQTPVAVFSADPPALDLGISYSFLSGGLASEPQVEGTVRTTLEVSSGPHGWHKSLGVVADQPFAGSSVKIRVPVDLTQARELISTIESETGIKASEYELVVATEVHTNGHVGTTAIDEVFRAPFTVIMSKNQFYMDPLLHRSEQRNDERAVTTPQTFDMLGRSLDVKKTRLTSAALLVGLLSATGVGAAVVFLGFGSSEIAKIRARYGSYLVTVKDVQLDPDPTRQIKLATVADLVKLAKRDNRMILHGTVLSGEHIYFIQDGPVTYIYEVAPTPTSTLTKTSEA